MTFYEESGDLFGGTWQSLGHGVNCVGLMGAGIAKPFADKFPLMYEQYSLMCKRGLLRPGGFMPYYVKDGRWVYNIASQNKPGADARLHALVNGTVSALVHARQWGVKELALPRIGCGIGGLDYDTQVRPALERISKSFYTDIIVVTP